MIFSTNPIIESLFVIVIVGLLFSMPVSIWLFVRRATKAEEAQLTMRQKWFRKQRGIRVGVAFVAFFAWPFVVGVVRALVNYPDLAMFDIYIPWILIVIVAYASIRALDFRALPAFPDEIVETKLPMPTADMNYCKRCAVYQSIDLMIVERWQRDDLTMISNLRCMDLDACLARRFAKNPNSLPTLSGEGNTVSAVIGSLSRNLPRCEKTGKVMFEPRSAPIIAERVGYRLHQKWEAKPCQYCPKSHVWRIDADQA